MTKENEDDGAENGDAEGLDDGLFDDIEYSPEDGVFGEFDEGEIEDDGAEMVMKW